MKTFLSSHQLKQAGPPGNYPALLLYSLVIPVALLFLYTGLNSLLYYEAATGKMQAQVFPAGWVPVLTGVNISVQLLTGLLLLFGLRRPGVLLYALISALLLTAIYTAYAEMVILHTFGSIPCACISWFAGMSWKGNFLLNLFLLIMVVCAFLMFLKERRYARKT